MGMSETILAAMIGALATVVTAVFQLMLAWREHRKRTEKTERETRGTLSSLLWMLTLLAAAAVGGFAYAHYRVQATRDETQALRDRLQQELHALTVSSARLEKLENAAPGAALEATARKQRGLDGVVAVVTLPACKGAQAGTATERSGCTEQDALQVTVCAPIPADASVSAVELFARADDSQQPWADARVVAGQDLGGGRFATSYSERPDGEGIKQVCQAFSHWSSDKGRSVRILVRYVG